MCQDWVRPGGGRSRRDSSPCPRAPAVQGRWGHGEGRATGGRFSTVVLGPPQKECLRCRKCEPRESCRGLEYQRGFQEEGGVMLWDRKEGWAWPGEARQGRFPGRGSSARRPELGVFWEPGGGRRGGGRRKERPRWAGLTGPLSPR